MIDFDPTTNRIPFGLLSWDEQKMLRDWPYDWEYYMIGEWRFIVTPSWEWGVVYRGKPKPVVTSRWFNLYRSASLGFPLDSREVADRITSSDRIAVLRIDTCNGVSTAHLEEI